MIIELKQDCEENVSQLSAQLLARGYQSTLVKTTTSTYLVCNGRQEVDLREFGTMQGVLDVFRVTDTYKLVSSQWRVKPTVIDLGGISIGDGDLCVMAGPCAIENEDQVEKIIGHLMANNIKVMRGGVFKPRSSPYSFRGLGMEGLKMFAHHCRKNDIKLITEVMEINQVEEMYEYVDVFQVGARNSQNFNLLDVLGQVDKPILLKRAMSGTLDELLHSAEYVFSRGNNKIMLCERGIRTFETAYRNTFDINAISLLREKTHLPVIADPSHGVGIRRHVPVIALAAAAAGADGIIYEVHPEPEKAKSDAQQTLDFTESSQLVENLTKIGALHLN